MGLVGQNGVVSRGVMAEDELGAGTSLDPEVLGGNGHPAVRTDPDGSTHTPDERPPGAAWNRAQDAAFLPLGQLPGLLGFHPQFAVGLVLVAM